jgi:hypothetical protein
VARKPITGESTKEAVKTVAQGMPGCLGAPVVNYSYAFFIACEAAGVTNTRHSLRPLLFEGNVQHLGRDRAAGMLTFALLAV